MIALTLTFLLLTITGTQCYPNGQNVDSACNSLVPNHPGTAKTTLPPYNITILTTSYNGTGNIELSINSCPKFPFKGFMIQARDSNNTYIGSFNVISGTRTACSGAALVHSSSNDKTSLPLTWVPPPNSTTNVFFRATFVAEEDEYWTNIVSNTLINTKSGSTEIKYPKTVVDWNCTVNSADNLWHGPGHVYTAALFGLLTYVLSLW